MTTFKHALMVTVLAAITATPLTACKLTDEAQDTAEKVKAAVAPCHTCGTVSDILPVKEKGDASGAGAVIGAVAGAVIGHQFGSGRGNDAATATGAIAGGITGHQVERRINSVTYYHVTVAMEDGGSRTIDLKQLNGLVVGSKVKVKGNDLELATR